MTELDLELRAIASNTTDRSSIDYNLRQRQRDARRRNLVSSDEPTERPASSNVDELHERTDSEQCPLLLCLRLVAYHNVSIFSVRRGRKWNTREDLGKGISFAVEQADLPVREAVSDLQYYDITKGRRDGFFTDHAGIKWSYDTVVAYKGLAAVGQRDKDHIFSDVLKELRVLCHTPLRRHPNIARFIGLAWIREEDIASEVIAEELGAEGSRELPILITEKAELGTLGDFVHYQERCRRRISLLAKARFLCDVLEAISVRQHIS
jgi:hypothetical protein